MRRFAAFLVFLFALLCFSPIAHAAETALVLTEDELRFIEGHPVIKLGIDPSFVPFEFIDKDGEYKGITADYLKLISKKTGLIFDIHKGLTWPEAYDMAVNGSLDALPAVSKTDERAQHFLFSEPYYYFKRVIVTRNTNTFIKGLEDLAGLTVAVQKNSSHHSYLLSFPQINLSLYDSVEAALTAVANGSETAFVGNLATTSYLIKSTGLTDLKFTAFESDKQQALYIAVRKDWPQLVSILNKALAGISEEEKILINNKWIPVETKADNTLMLQVLAMLGAVFLIVVAVSLYWIVRLRSEIKKRIIVQTDLQKAKKEAEDANAIKSNFMARMSHEIRTPLNAITGMAYLLKKTQITLTQKMYIERITQASNNMLSIINDILDFSKIEAGKVELEIIPFSLDEVIQDVVNIISFKIEERAIGFKLTKDPKIANCFFGDPKRIEQILINIINNAVKFTTIGEISLDIRLAAKEADQYHIVFTIKDTGIGMTPAQLDQLFEPFTQGDISINRRFGGTGLGLSIVKDLIDMMDGKIEVYSAENEGSTFIINICLKLDKEKEDEYKQQISEHYFGDIKTLVLEKTGASMNIIDSYLSAFGMSCELTTSYFSALSMLETEESRFSKPFDLLIIDYDTPPEGGLKFIETLRSNKKIIKMPKIIMLLPMLRDDLFDKLDECRIEIGITKPIIPSVLFNAILEIFSIKAIAANTTVEKEEIQMDVGNARCVLIVEDNKTNQLIVKSLLRQAGFTVLIAGDGKEGVEMYQAHAHEIDLILMDLHMPVMNGYDASMQIRQSSKSVPIVAMTADAVQGIKDKCEKHGIHHYISKPFKPETFINTINEIISMNAEDTQPLNILDRAKGLECVGNDDETYALILEEYYNENQETASKLYEAIEQKNYSDAAMIVHKVKSSSGSIGANKLYQVSIVLQKALEEDNVEVIQSNHMLFTQLLEGLLTEIHAGING